MCEVHRCCRAIGGDLFDFTLLAFHLKANTGIFFAGFFDVFQHQAEGLFFLLRGFLFEPTIKVLIAETQISTSTFRVNGLIRYSALLKTSNLDVRFTFGSVIPGVECDVR